MKKLLFLILASAPIFPLISRGAEDFNALLQRQNAEYDARQIQAADTLVRTRERIAREKIPLLEQLRKAEDEIIALESKGRQAETDQEHANELRRNLLKEIDSISKTRSYVNTLAHDSLKATVDGFAPGEMQVFKVPVQTLQQKLEQSSSGVSAEVALGAAEFLFARTQRLLGGLSAEGDALSAEDNRVNHGNYAFVGPETYFLSQDRARSGVVRMREGSELPVAHSVASWKTNEAVAFFFGAGGTIVADASAGKALKLQETKGTLGEHIRKGGGVAYAILAVGLVALILILQKLLDVARMGIDSPETVRGFLADVMKNGYEQGASASPRLKSRTAQLFATGLAHRAEPKPLLEEHLQAVLLEQRLHLERRLPLLAVIATAAPLMGLLGTVVGMVRTFALITVFGTGNAGKLSSGISEVLVATELGLVVAIPTLVIHGFLASRIQKMMALQERYALQLVIAIETEKARRAPGLVEPVTAK